MVDEYAPSPACQALRFCSDSSMVDEYGDTVLYFRGHEASSDSSMVDEYQRDRVDVAVELAFRFLYGR